MRYDQLGNTGPYVSGIYLDTVTCHAQDTRKMVDILEQPTARRLTGPIREAGVNFPATADVCSEDCSKQMVWQSFKDLALRSSDSTCATKCYRRAGRGVNDISALAAGYLGGMLARQSTERVPG